MEYNSLREFKAGLTPAFNSADEGASVKITRNGITYILVTESRLQEMVSAIFQQRVDEARERNRNYTPPVYKQEYDAPTRPNPDWQPSTLERTTRDVMEEINAIKADLATGINQDPDYHAAQNEKMQTLWAEYHALKDAQL